MNKKRLLKIVEDNGLPKPLFGPGQAVIVVPLVPANYANIQTVSPGPEPGERDTMTAEAFTRWTKKMGFVKPNGKTSLKVTAEWLNQRLPTHYGSNEVWKWVNDQRAVPQRVIDLIKQGEVE